MTIPIEVGDTVTLGQGDYIFGTGTVTLKIIELGQIHNSRGEQYINVKAVDMSGQARQVSLRVAALANAVRPQ